MTASTTRTLTLLSAFLLAPLALLGGAAAQDYRVGGIEIVRPWARATPKGSNVAAGYLTISNKGTGADRLVGGATEAAARFEIHRMSMSDGVMTMRPVAGGLELKPGETVEFKPGSFHVMLIGLKGPLEKGQRVKATLEFANAGKVEIEFLVEAIGAPGPSAGQMRHGH
jgi:hypothetical protein